MRQVEVGEDSSIPFVFSTDTFAMNMKREDEDEVDNLEGTPWQLFVLQ